MSELTLSRRADWLVPAGLILLSALPAVAGTVTLASLAAGTDITARNARFAAEPAPIVLHILAAMSFSILGAFQFAPRFRRERRGWHRAAGRVLAPLGLLAALTGLWMAHFYPWPAGDGEVLYALRLVFGSAMAVSILLSVDAIRRREFVAHGHWMSVRHRSRCGHTSGDARAIFRVHWHTRRDQQSGAHGSRVANQRHCGGTDHSSAPRSRKGRA